MIMNIEEAKAGGAPASMIEESKEKVQIVRTKGEELIEKFGPFKSQINIKTE